MFLPRIVLTPAHLLSIIAITSLGCQKKTLTIVNSVPVRHKEPSPIVAMIGSKAVRLTDMWPSLIELGGETVMQELTLRAALESVLHEQGVIITPSAIETERRLLSSSTSSMDHQIIDDMLKAKGYGEHRLKQLLWRNAALRALVVDDVVITDDAVRRMYSIIHGSAYPVRIIVVTTLEEASEITSKLGKGASFFDLAVENSIDSSAMQGGIVQPISIADPTWPAPIREAIPALSIGEISDPILIGDRWVILTVTGVAMQSNVEFEEAKVQMHHLATLAQERFLMENLATQLQQQFDPILFDDVLKRVLRSD